MLWTHTFLCGSFSKRYWQLSHRYPWSVSCIVYDESEDVSKFKSRQTLLNRMRAGKIQGAKLVTFMSKPHPNCTPEENSSVCWLKLRMRRPSNLIQKLMYGPPEKSRTGECLPACRRVLSWTRAVSKCCSCSALVVQVLLAKFRSSSNSKGTVGAE